MEYFYTCGNLHSGKTGFLLEIDKNKNVKVLNVSQNPPHTRFMKEIINFSNFSQKDKKKLDLINRSRWEYSRIPILLEWMIDNNVLLNRYDGYYTHIFMPVKLYSSVKNKIVYFIRHPVISVFLNMIDFINQKGICFSIEELHEYCLRKFIKNMRSFKSDKKIFVVKFEDFLHNEDKRKNLYDFIKMPMQNKFKNSRKYITEFDVKRIENSKIADSISIDRLDKELYNFYNTYEYEPIRSLEEITQ